MTTLNIDPAAPGLSATLSHEQAEPVTQVTPHPRAPRRVQLRRTKGWRKPESAIVVSRPTKWGNPFRVQPDENGEFTRAARSLAVQQFRRSLGQIWYPSVEQIKTDLAGRDLACWCPLVDESGQRMPCHADVLLEIANPGWVIQ